MPVGGPHPSSATCKHKVNLFVVAQITLSVSDYYYGGYPLGSHSSRGRARDTPWIKIRLITLWPCTLAVSAGEFRAAKGWRADPCQHELGENFRKSVLSDKSR